MQVYLSYAYADRELARRVAAFLLDAGFTVWDAEQQIFPGDNWAEKIGQALKESSAMVVLLTPEALKSVYVRREIDYALSQKAYSHRLITVLADSPDKFTEETIPWILRRLKIINLYEQSVENGLSQIAQALTDAA